jgi:hypothetical protein
VIRCGRGVLTGAIVAGSKTGDVARDTLFAGTGTGCPHFRQNCESSGRFALHRLHNTSASLRSKFDMIVACDLLAAAGKTTRNSKPRLTTKDTKTH